MRFNCPREFSKNGDIYIYIICIYYTIYIYSQLGKQRAFKLSTADTLWVRLGEEWTEKLHSANLTQRWPNDNWFVNVSKPLLYVLYGWWLIRPYWVGWIPIWRNGCKWRNAVCIHVTSQTQHMLFPGLSTTGHVMNCQSAMVLTLMLPVKGMLF